MHRENIIKNSADETINDDDISQAEKLNHIAGVFHEQIDDIVMQLKENVMMDEDLLAVNLLRRVILISINVYGFSEVADAIETFLDEAISYTDNSIQ